MVPKKLQAVLWSVGTDKLDLHRDKEYIIHQILAYGRWEDVVWLFNTYSRDKVKQVFVHYPSKDYTPASLKFASNILLGIDQALDINKYDRSTPRIIG